MKRMLTENIEICVEQGRLGVVATIAGGYSDHGAAGWAFVIADRLQKRGIDCRVQASNGNATMTVNGRGLYEEFCVCVEEAS